MKYGMTSDNFADQHWSIMLRSCIILGLIFLASTTSISQTDNILWSGVQLRKKIDPTWSLQLQPIFRFDQNFGGYQNSSIDLSLRRQLGNGWHAQLLSRTWFVPDRTDRQFVWLDIGYKADVPSWQLSISNRLRYHHAIDIKDGRDIDYIRHLVQLVPTTQWKLKPTFALEYWWQIDDVPQGIDYRIVPGLRYQFSKRIGLTTLLRKQHMTSTEGEGFFANLWVVALVYNL